MPTAINPPTQPAPPPPYQNQGQTAEMSVILCTAGCKSSPYDLIHLARFNHIDDLLDLDDHSIRFWEAWSGICYRQITLQPQWVRPLPVSQEGSLTGGMASRSRSTDWPSVPIRRISLQLGTLLFGISLPSILKDY